MNMQHTSEYDRWPALEPKASLAEIEYCVRTLLGIGDMKLGKYKDADGRYITGRTIQHTIARSLLTSLMRGLRGMSYTQCADYMGLAHSTLVTLINNPLSTSPFMIEAHNSVMRRILSNRELAKVKP